MALGLREGGYIFLLGGDRHRLEKGIAFGLLLFLIVALDSLIGGVLFLLQRQPRPAPATATIGLNKIAAKHRREAEK